MWVIVCNTVIFLAETESLSTEHLDASASLAQLGIPILPKGTSAGGGSAAHVKCADADVKIQMKPSEIL